LACHSIKRRSRFFKYPLHDDVATQNVIGETPLTAEERSERKLRDTGQTLNMKKRGRTGQQLPIACSAYFGDFYKHRPVLSRFFQRYYYKRRLECTARVYRCDDTEGLI
jgi:hypothetical protein